MEKSDKWREAKTKELKSRIKKLAEKIIHITADVTKFGPQRYGSILKPKTVPRSPTQKHNYEMARRSLVATRKKIYKLQEELKAL